MTPKATLEYLGTHWPHSGNLYTMRHPDGREARVFVDSLGETWVDVRIIPDGGYFYSERVAAWRAFRGAEDVARELSEKGYADRRPDRYAHRVIEREL